MYKIIENNSNVDIDQVISAHEMIMLENKVWTTNKEDTLSLLVILMEQKGADSEIVAVSEIMWFLRCIYARGSLEGLTIRVWNNQGENKHIANVLTELIEIESNFKMKKMVDEFYRYLLSQGGLTFLKVYLHIKRGILDFLELRELLKNINKQGDVK